MYVSMCTVRTEAPLSKSENLILDWVSDVLSSDYTYQETTNKLTCEKFSNFALSKRCIKSIIQSYLYYTNYHNTNRIISRTLRVKFTVEFLRTLHLFSLTRYYVIETSIFFKFKRRKYNIYGMPQQCKKKLSLFNIV